MAGGLLLVCARLTPVGYSGDRIVLAYSSGTSSMSSKLLVMGLSSTTLSGLNAGAQEKFEVSSLADNIAITTLSQQALILAYRVRNAYPVCAPLELGCVCPFSCQ